MIVGLVLVLLATFFQGTFLLPMALTRKWAWEHSWAVFSLFAMWLLNWTLAWALLPDPWRLYASIPRSDLLLLILFGAAWGCGAVLFGLGMDKLGLTLGYPLIMGLNAAAGALVPLLWFGRGDLLSPRSLFIISGTAVALAGIVLCSIAGAARSRPAQAVKGARPAFASGLAIGVAAGCLSCLPNIGLTFAAGVLSTARAMGASAAQAGNAVWAVFFTVAGVVNLAYCALRMVRNRNFHFFAAPGSLRNLGLGAIMSLMWIGSFYCYGAGAARLGVWGPVAGWPILMCGSIGVGVLWGLWKGEWKNAPARAGRLLGAGLLLILLAVLLLAFAS
jgi:L-rhamnose-H+ transport protein